MESEAAFVLSVSANYGCQGSHGPARVVDSISCRQMYLRSYTFTSEEKMSAQERITQECFGRVKEKAKNNRRRLITRLRQGKKCSAKCVNVKRKCVVLRRAKEVSCAALLSLFRRLMLSSTAEVDVADSPY